MNQFELTQDHIALLTSGRIYVGWQDCETGAPEIDPKRPYGNSYVPGDVAEILGWPVDEDGELSEEDEERALALHRETDTALQVVLNAKTFEPGIYVADQYRVNWRRI